MDPLTLHACEQILRFTRVANWHDLTEERKVQLGYNLGVVALGLGLSKADAYDALANARQGILPMPDLHAHFARLIAHHQIPINLAQVNRTI